MKREAGDWPFRKGTSATASQVCSYLLTYFMKTINVEGEWKKKTTIAKGGEGEERW